MEDSGFRIPSFCLRARMELSFDNSDGGVLTMESHRSVPAPFLTKTYHLVEDPATDDVVSWGEDGTTFVVWRPPDFAKDVLPNYFKHNNFSSFVRQLNTYGFRKIVSDRWEFANEFFKKGQQNLLTEIHRRKTGQASCTGGTSQSPVIAATRSQEEISWPHISQYPSAAATICDENERLRRDNCVLISELARLRRMNDEVFTFLQNNVRLPLQDLGCIRWTRFNHAALPGLLPAGPGSRLQEIDDGPGIKGRMDGSELIVRGCLAPFLKENAAPRASTLSFLDGKLKELAAKESVVRANAGPKLFGFPLRKRSHLNLPYQNDDRDPSPPSKRHSSPESKSSSESNSEDPYWLKLCRPSSSDSHQRIFL